MNGSGGVLLAQVGDGGALVLGGRRGRQGGEPGLAPHHVLVPHEDAAAELVDVTERGERGEAALRVELDDEVVVVGRVDVPEEHPAVAQAERDRDVDAAGADVPGVAGLVGAVLDAGRFEELGQVGFDVRLDRGRRVDPGLELQALVLVLTVAAVELCLGLGFGRAATDESEHSWTSWSCFHAAPI